MESHEYLACAYRNTPEIHLSGHYERGSNPSVLPASPVSHTFPAIGRSQDRSSHSLHSQHKSRRLFSRMRQGLPDTRLPLLFSRTISSPERLSRVFSSDHGEK